MSANYGPHLRLWGLCPSQLPSETASAQDLTPFLNSVLSEAVPFISSVPSSSGKASTGGPWKLKGRKTFRNSSAPVDMYERTVSAGDIEAVAKEHNLPHAKKLRAETWTLRRSVHADAREAGTASWDEWTEYFKKDHAQVEMSFTPTVIATKRKKQWDCSDVKVVLEGGGSAWENTWENFTLKLEESVHKMPAPLNNRVFPVLQATASARGRREFIVVQMAAVPAGGGGAGAEEEEESRPDGALRGTYTSVERFRETDDGGVEWLMGTVSDARGVLPAWVQKMAVPGAVAKDVDMFLEWIAGERRKG